MGHDRLTQRILFYPDCGAEIGGGHVMRSLTLAEALAARGATCAFAATPMIAGIVAQYGTGAVQTIEGDPAEAAAQWSPDWLLIDHYRLTTADETALRAPGRRIAVIDDLATRERDADLVLDPSYGRREADYAALTPPGAVILTGPSYALLRPQFAAARPAALARRGEGAVRRGLISMGLTDVGGVTETVVRLLLPQLGDTEIDVVVGAAAPSLAALRAIDPRVTLHIETRDMARLIAEADLAVGAGGSSTWERACLGLPCITVVLADNQRALARLLARDGATATIEAADLGGALGEAWRALAGDGAARTAMAAKGAALCDGLGAERAAERILAL